MNFAFLSSILAALIGLSLIFLAPFSTWDSLNIVGSALVLLGIGREFWLLLNKLPKESPPEAEAKKHKQEIRAALVVILGVALELIVVPHSLLEVAGLKLQTAELEATNQTMWQTNIWLRSNLVALELKIQPRIITPEQVTNFTFLTENIKKIPITVSMGAEGFDTEIFAVQLRNMLSQAGFGTNEGGVWGVKRDISRMVSTQIGTEIHFSDLVLVLPSRADFTNLVAQRTTYQQINGFNKPISASTNDWRFTAT